MGYRTVTVCVCVRACVCACDHLHGDVPVSGPVRACLILGGWEGMCVVCVRLVWWVCVLWFIGS